MQPISTRFTSKRERLPLKSPILRMKEKDSNSKASKLKPSVAFNYDCQSLSFYSILNNSMGLIEMFSLSSPRAESARAFTGRRCPHSGKGEDFLTGQPDFFTETAVTPERKVEKSFPRWEINRHVEG